MTRFDAARRDALMSDLVRAVRGLPSDLLPFDAVRETLRLKSFVDRGLHEVPLDQIVGSLGRVQEFNRAFLPREESLRGRWRQVWDLAEGPAGFPPIELFKVGDAYFVVDGHHRVSVLRSMGAPTVEARVKEYLTPVPLESTETLEQVLLKQGLAEFLEATGLAPAHRDDLRVSAAHGYDRLLEHVAVHRYYRSQQESREIPWPEAVASWRDAVYRPMVEIIRGSGIMKSFPRRTETDLYLFTMDHLHHLREQYGDDRIPPESAVEELRRSVEPEPRLFGRLSEWWRARRRSS